MNGSEIFHTHKNGIQNRLLSAHLMENPWKISKEGVIITCMQIYRENKWFINEEFTFAFAFCMLDDLSGCLGSSSNMAARKQNTFQDRKKSAYFHTSN